MKKEKLIEFGVIPPSDKFIDWIKGGKPVMIRRTLPLSLIIPKILPELRKEIYSIVKRHKKDKEKDMVCFGLSMASAFLDYLEEKYGRI